jgi:hypothetical protein
MNEIIDTLLLSKEPSIRYKIRSTIFEQNPEYRELINLQQEIQNSSRVKILLSERDNKGEIPFWPYKKWFGAHWVLVALADLDYPKNDHSLIPLKEQVLNWLLSDDYLRLITVIGNITRIHASIDGNAIYALLKLGLADQRIDILIDRLLQTQWPDGGWNCDKKSSGKTSSFMETLIPFRALVLHAKITGNSRSKEAADKASEVFLQRKLFKRKRDGQIIYPEFSTLHYPCYWHYDILFGLKVMAEAGFINDIRCNEALDLLQSKQVKDGGFPAEKRYYQLTDKITSGRSLVKWGITSKKQMNEFVTADALYALKKAGRL